MNITNSLSINVQILDEKSIILKNTQSKYYNDAFEIIPNTTIKTCVFKYYLLCPNVIKCINSQTSTIYSIFPKQTFTCILYKDDLFWTFNKNNYYSLKSFTQFRLHKPTCVSIEYYSNTAFFSRAYITTWFNHRITILCLSDKLYIIPVFVSNELFVRTNTITTFTSHGSWQTEIYTDVQFHDKIRHYNSNIKFKKLLNVVYTILRSLNDNLLSSTIKAFT